MTRAERAGVWLSDSALDGLESYFELLRKWNRKVSLTSLPVDEMGDEAIDRLVIEPGLAVRYLPSSSRMVIDVGSGGGSPAIPMKVMVPELSLTMVESKTRKAAFLREVVRTLALDRVKVEACRFEELLARPQLHESADAVTVRAIRISPNRLAALLSFIRPGGAVLMFGTSAPEKALAPVGAGTRLSHQLLPYWGSQLDVVIKPSRP